MGQIVSKPLCGLVTTDLLTGIGIFSVKIAGTFNGFDPESANGRFLRSVDIFSDDGANGDRGYGFRIEDVDGVVPVLFRPQFPSYPVLSYLYDDELVETETIFRGAWIQPGRVNRIESPTGMLTQFIPSGLWVIGNVKSVVPGKIFRANFQVGKRS